jgi:hypothetical protein
MRKLRASGTAWQKVNSIQRVCPKPTSAQSCGVYDAGLETNTEDAAQTHL